MSNITERIAALSPAKKLLLLSQLAAKRSTSSTSPSPDSTPAPAAPGGSQAPPIQRASRTRPLPLSYAQQRLWFLSRLEPGPVYNLPVVLRLRGPLDLVALDRSVREVRRRHEVLRTRFPLVDGMPIQEIDAAGSPDGGAGITLPVIDLQAIAEDARDAAVRRLVMAEARRPFDLARGPVIRTHVLRVAGDEHVLQATLHHIVTDGWSTALLVRELTTLYAAYHQGGTSPLPEPPLQYADFAVWQRQWLQGETLESRLDYWRTHLAGVPPLALPTDRTRPAVPSHRGAAVPIVIPADLGAALRVLGQREGVTPFMTLIAAFQLVLGRWAGQRDVVVGADIANRTSQETESLIGFFVNQLALRTHLDPGLTVRALLARVRETMLAAYVHQDVPFEQVVEALQPVRDLSRAPVFQAKLVLQNAPGADLQLDQLRIEGVGYGDRTSKLDLTCVLQEHGDVIAGDIEYATDLFEPATIERLASHYLRVLAQFAAGPARRLNTITLLDAADREQVVETWNTPGATGAPDTGEPAAIATDTPLAVPQQLAAHASTRADAIAVVSDAGHVTYAALVARVNQVAHVLRARGIAPEMCVGICLDRGIDFVVAMLGVMTAGAAYLPIDPAGPIERLAYMLGDAQAPVVVTTAAMQDRLPSTWAQLLLLDRDAAEIAAAPASDPGVRHQPEQMTYVIYTSGSTGQPKGVAIEARHLARYVHEVRQRLDLDSTLRYGWLSTVSADLGHTMLFAALCAGGALCIVPASAASDASKLTRLFRQLGVDCLKITPSHLRALTAGDFDAALLPARRLVFGGESAESAWVADLQRRSPACAFWNHYGPTECTVGAVAGRIDASSRNTWIALGKPLPHARVYVLDEAGTPVPAGVPGELYIGGAGVGRGYLHRPALTAERFVPDPFARAPGARLYRTGDRARWRADGTLDFLGRVDFQVKLRGFRVELGEVEAALLELPGVTQAAAIVRAPETGGEPQLVAYIVPTRAGDTAAAAVRDALRSRLPDYMVPGTVVVLDALPMTANGKVDRHALPAPDISPDTVAAPRTPVEEMLAAIWARVLGRPAIGIHDNFFELGGDSILSIQIVSRAAQAGVQLTVQDLFQHQTIAALAAHATASADTQPAPIDDTPAPLTPIQQSTLARLTVNPHHFNLSALLEVSADADVPALIAALRHVVNHHAAFRTRFVRDTNGHWTHTVLAAPSSPVVARVRLDTLSDSRLALERIAIALHGSLHLEHGPLWRAALVTLGGGLGMRLLIVVHHLIIDGISWRVLLEDLQAAYAQRRHRLPIRLPPAAPFGPWAHALARRASSEALVREAAYWTSRPWNLVRPLPCDFEAGGVTETDVVNVDFTAAQTRALLERLPRTLRIPLDQMLIAAIVESVSAWSAHTHVLLDVEHHGREEIGAGLDTSRTIGLFTTVAPVLLQRGTHERLLDRVQATCQELREVPGRGLGFGLLRWLCADASVRRALETVPTPQIFFNYLGQFDQVLDADGIFERANESAGPDEPASNARATVLGISGSIGGGQLHLAWRYDTRLHRRDSIAKLASMFRDTVEQVLDAEATPSAMAAPGSATAYTEAEAFLPGGDLSRIRALVGVQVAPDEDD
jgi:amino acid adenylation domain-containing protein/non-ribosomal peptide synthase protein (TIGR01720 family)